MSTPTTEDINRLYNHALDYRLRTWRKGGDPEPLLGDLVLVTSVEPSEPPEDLLGVFDSCWTYVYPPEDGEPFAERPRELVYAVKRLDTGEMTTWTNVSLWKVVG